MPGLPELSLTIPGQPEDLKLKLRPLFNLRLLVQVSLCRTIKEREGSLLGHTPFALVEDEVLGLHPVPEVDSPALRRESASLAARLRWQAAADGKASAAASLGRVSVAYPAGFAADLSRFAMGSSALGALLTHYNLPPPTHGCLCDRKATYTCYSRAENTPHCSN